MDETAQRILTYQFIKSLEVTVPAEPLPGRRQILGSGGTWSWTSRRPFTSAEIAS